MPIDIEKETEIISSAIRLIASDLADDTGALEVSAVATVMARLSAMVCTFFDVQIQKNPQDGQALFDVFLQNITKNVLKDDQG